MIKQKLVDLFNIVVLTFNWFVKSNVKLLEDSWAKLTTFAVVLLVEFHYVTLQQVEHLVALLLSRMHLFQSWVVHQNGTVAFNHNEVVSLQKGLGFDAHSTKILLI
jgi:hypothetical protein